ncbi:MAG TPA: glycine betaine ABC transporter substrate-binding protein, partial [Gammaproteobacteria bacterium]|nr:glycine betaine ABC transporter substrate-binding protein [Gammaproteobacteria bacterium]
MIARIALLTVVAIGAARVSQAGEPSLVTVGSKVFTESVILGEIAAHLLESEGLKVRHRSQLGGTQLLWSALLSGEIDLYPEYTGTLMTEILRSKVGPGADPGELQRVLLSYGVGMSEPLGFNNTYALGITTSRARQLGIAAISDLRRYPELKFGFSNEFMDRLDGWHGLRRHYSLPQADVVGLDHNLAYRGLMSGAIDVIDLYTTDADIQYYRLTVLQDDGGYFPDYQAVLLYRADAAARVPSMSRAVKRLEGAIAQETMIAMNARAKLDRVPETQIAAEFLQKWLGLHRKPPIETLAMRLWKHTVEHISL